MTTDEEILDTKITVIIAYDDLKEKIATLEAEVKEAFEKGVQRHKVDVDKSIHNHLNLPAEKHKDCRYCALIENGRQAGLEEWRSSVKNDYWHIWVALPERGKWDALMKSNRPSYDHSADWIMGALQEFILSEWQFKEKIATLEAENAGLALQKFGEGISHTEDRLWNFIIGKTRKPPETSFTAGKSRDIAREFARRDAEVQRLRDEIAKKALEAG